MLTRTLSLLTLTAAIEASAAGGDFTWKVGVLDGLPVVPADVAVSAEGYMAVSSAGYVFTSADWSQWAVQKIPGEHEIRALTNWKGNWIAAEKDGSVIVLPAGSSTWQQCTIPGDSLIRVTSFAGSDNEVLGISDGAIIRSTDAFNWTVGENPAGGGPGGLHVRYGGGVYILSATDMPSLWASPNGSEWATINFDDAPGFFDGSIAYGDGVWLAGFGGSVVRSEDAVHWELLYTLDNSMPGPEASLSFADGKFYFYSSPPLIHITSDDGDTWSNRGLESNNGPQITNPRVLGGPGGTFICQVDPHESGIWPAVATVDETSHITWKTQLSSSDMNFAPEFVHANLIGGMFVYSSEETEGQPLTWTSMDGDTWTAIDPEAVWESQVDNKPGAVAYGHTSASAFGGGRWVLASRRQVLVSDDGTNWTLRNALLPPSADATSFEGMCYFQGKFYTVIDRMSDKYPQAPVAIMSSSDGIIWSTVTGITIPSGASRGLVAATEDTLLVVFSGGNNPQSYYTSDGTSWSSITGLFSSTVQIRARTDDFLAIPYRGLQGGTWSPTSGWHTLGIRPPSDSQARNLWSLASIGDLNFVLGDDGRIYAGNALLNLSDAQAPFPVCDVLANGTVVVGFGPKGTFTVDPNYVWNASSRYLNGWIASPWYGWLFDGTFPWVYHAGHGWEYEVSTPDGDIYTWDIGLNRWVWTSQSFYPWLWVFGDDGRWVYYDVESTTPDRVYWDTATSGWDHEADIAMPAE